MPWEPLNQLTLSDIWQFTDETDSEFFQIRHSNLGSVARAMFCQATIINDKVFLYQIREMSANQNEIWKIEKPPIFTNRRLAFLQNYGEKNWSIQIEEFMGIYYPPATITLETSDTAEARSNSLSTTESTLCEANANRKGLSFYNSTNSVMLISKVTGISNSTFQFKLWPGGHYIHPMQDDPYVGAWFAILDSGTGSAQVIESV